MKHLPLKSLLMALLALMPMATFAQLTIEEEVYDTVAVDTAEFDEPHCHKCYEPENTISKELNTLCEKCFKELSASVKSGDLDATIELARHYASAGQPKKAEALYKKAAASGKPQYQLTLGEFYLDYWLADELYDKELGVEWMEKAANQDYTEAQYALAKTYIDGEYAENKEAFTKAATLLEKTITHYRPSGFSIPDWYIESPHDLGFLYYKGWGVPQNYEKAKELVEKSIERGSDNARLTLAQMIVFGDASKLDVKWYEEDSDEKIQTAFAKSCRKASAADLDKAMRLLEDNTEYYNDNTAMLAQIYAAKGNMAEAIKLWNIGVENDNDDACYNLGYCYYEGKGVAKNIKKAIELWQKGCDENYSSRCGYPLGLCYMKGEGVKKDAAKAAECFDTSYLSVPEAAFELAKCHETGNGVEKSIAEAFNYYSIAAKGGIEEAKSILMRSAKNYETGNGVEKDLNMALMLYGRAAQSNIPGGMEGAMRMAKCFETGNGVEEDKDKAFAIYFDAFKKLNYEPAKSEARRLGLSIAKELEKEAEGIDRNLEKATAAYYIAYLAGDETLKDKIMSLATRIAKAYDKGTDGVEKDPDTAHVFYELLVELGDNKAKEDVKRLKKIIDAQ